MKKFQSPQSGHFDSYYKRATLAKPPAPFQSPQSHKGTMSGQCDSYAAENYRPVKRYPMSFNPLNRGNVILTHVVLRAAELGTTRFNPLNLGILILTEDYLMTFFNSLLGFNPLNRGILILTQQMWVTQPRGKTFQSPQSGQETNSEFRRQNDEWILHLNSSFIIQPSSFQASPQSGQGQRSAFSN